LEGGRWYGTRSAIFGNNVPERVTICEVGCRDGLQNEKMLVPTDIKVELIQRLGMSGLRTIEATSFVSPRWVPQMSDNFEIMSQLDTSQARFPVLVPNKQGLLSALEAGTKAIAFFTAASETFCQKNMNCTYEDSLARFRECLRHIPDDVHVRGYVSCVLGCPYEHGVSYERVAEVCQDLVDLGCHEISLGDTIGIGTAGETALMLEEVLKKIPKEMLAVHFHDTYGQALSNILVSLQMGIGTVDSSVSGLGGCPYAPAASGNVATEDVVYMLHGMGIETGIDLDMLVQTGEWISSILGRPTGSKVSLARSPTHGRDYGSCVRNFFLKTPSKDGQSSTYSVRQIKDRLYEK